MFPDVNDQHQREKNLSTGDKWQRHAAAVNSASDGLGWAMSYLEDIHYILTSSIILLHLTIEADEAKVVCELCTLKS